MADCEDEGDGEMAIDPAITSRSKDENEAEQMQNNIIKMEEYEYILHRSHHKVLVRQLPSRGLSFQVWPAASALCWFLDETFWHYSGVITTAHQDAPTPTSIPICTKQQSANGFELNPEVGHISHQLLHSRGNRQALRVLELGAGTGMVGIASAFLGAHVTITDLPHVLPNLLFNATANEESLRATGLGGCVCVKALRWGEEKDARDVGHRNFDLVLASDVVYHENLFDPLLLTLKWLLLGINDDGGQVAGEGNPIVLMAHLRRWKKDAHFFKKAKKLFDVRVVYRHPPKPGSRLGVAIYSFTNKGMNRASI
jgi:2-polyprenyl-3-methyl-5-hydroxy-6-metoxy-1,4-benzoquinol methylase